MLALGLGTGLARADGDPASDVLLTQNLYLPPDAGASARQQAQLEAVIAAAARSGYPVRVAVIASPADLGAVAALWRNPHTYAPFLGQELSLVSNARVLVAMPDGFGLYHRGPALPAEQAALLRARPAGGTSGLAVAALTTVESLADATGHRIPGTVVAAARPGTARGGSRGTVDTIAFAAGAVIIAAAWGVSLRARPLRAPFR